MRIAIVGAGVSGLVTAHLLHREHEVTVFEASAWAGGHVNTVDVQFGERRYAVDTGFIVYNQRTYPLYCRLLAKLGVASKPTRMSFSASCQRCKLEWCGISLDTVFAQRRNLLRPSFHRMLRDILRFNRECRALLEDGAPDPSLGDYLSHHGYSRAFVEHYITPLGAAVWSADPAEFMHMPARFLVRS